MARINMGFYTSATVSLIAFGFLAAYYMHAWRAFLSVAVGIILAIVIDELTKYYTSPKYAPVKEIANSSSTGTATLILSGLVSGIESSVWSMVVLALTLGSALLIYWGQPVSYTLYGIALTGIGMLTLTGNNVAMDSFGPIADNANGIGEMAGLEPEARQIMADLDAVGNTTKAITKGVAIGSAVIAAVALFSSFLTDVSRIQASLGVDASAQLLSTGIRISVPRVFIGLLLGGALPWLFAGLTIHSVWRAASLIVNEVRRQFKLPGIMEGTVAPDYAQAVGICTSAAQKQLIGSSVLVVLTPIIVGFILDVEALAGFLAGAIISAQMLAVFMSNAGGAWDNAKKSIEDGMLGGKGSGCHKSSVVGDTVGDPLKDTAGPSMNPMIKVINLIAILAAPSILKYTRASAGVIIAVTLSILAIIVSVWYSRHTGRTELIEIRECMYEG